MEALDPSKTISPRDLAKAIGVSESSLKRWADRGLLSVTRTAGGHRRIRVKEAIRFVRERKLVLAAPRALGLPVAVTDFADEALTELNADHDSAAHLGPFVELLDSGRGELAESYLVGRFLSGESIAEIGDEVIRPALEHLGHGPHGAQEILKEHRATQVCVQAIEQMRSLSALEKPFFRAVGGGAAGSTYMLPSQLVAGLVEESGGRAVNLGANTPIRALRCEAFPSVESRPSAGLIWLSVSEPLSQHQDELGALKSLIAECASSRVHLMLGGRASLGLGLSDHQGPHFQIHDTLLGMYRSIQALFTPEGDISG